MPEFRVAHLGRRALGRAQYPWMQYSFGAQDQWGEGHIQNVWEDWSRGKFGVILTVWDASRLTWFGNPTGIEGELGNFLRSRNQFEKWGYFMQDGSGVDPSKLPLKDAYTMAGYDRVLLASKWAYELAKNSLVQHPDLDWLPHGIDRSVFKPVDRLYARSAWRQWAGWGLNDKVVGCCMANLERKHWPVVFEAIARLEGVKLWAHTDRLRQYWDLEALTSEYGIGERVILDERDYTDEEMAMRYSGCDCTVVISGGEGFCYPVAESLSCGVPCISGRYGAQSDLLSFGL
jgi:glycosyltransferase involved in cell wall biosynthesis